MGEFKVVYEEIKGDVSVTSDTLFNNIQVNKIIVLENVTARLYGTVKDVILKKGSKLYLHGQIQGTIENEGGELFTFYR